MAPPLVAPLLNKRFDGVARHRQQRARRVGPAHPSAARDPGLARLRLHSTPALTSHTLFSCMVARCGCAVKSGGGGRGGRVTAAAERQQRGAAAGAAGEGRERGRAGRGQARSSCAQHRACARLGAARSLGWAQCGPRHGGGTAQRDHQYLDSSSATSRAPPRNCTSSGVWVRWRVSLRQPRAASGGPQLTMARAGSGGRQQHQRAGGSTSRQGGSKAGSQHQQAHRACLQDEEAQQRREVDGAQQRRHQSREQLQVRVGDLWRGGTEQ